MELSAPTSSRAAALKTDCSRCNSCPEIPERTESCNDPIVNHKYKECVSHWRYVTKQHHIQAEETLVDSKNFGSFYKFINKRISIVDQNGHMATDDYSKACTFNSYFASVGCSDNNCLAYPSRSTPCYVDSVNFQPNCIT